MKRFVFRVLDIVGTLLVVALVAGLGWLAWNVLPQESRDAVRHPSALLDSARRGAAAPRTDLIAAVLDSVRGWIADRQDRADVVRASDGSTGGIAPLPPLSASPHSHVFGATETLWQSRRAKLAGVQWSRVVFSWADVQPRGPRDWRAGYYLRDDLLRRERANGVEVVGLLMNTPAWAAAAAPRTTRSVPAGLERPIGDPQNTWAVFVRKMAGDYRGRIDTWIVWNEPDVPANGPNAAYHTWDGDERAYALLLKTAYLAAKQANPNARVLFASTSYWPDANDNRPLFLERVLSILAQDPEAPAHGHYFDAVGLNLYSSPDDLRRVSAIYRDVLARYGSEAPLWLTETNAVPYDDPEKALRREQNGLRVTMDEQASFVVQAAAMGLSAGFERIAVHSMEDRDTQDELWGLVRNDGTLRPAFVAYQTVVRYLSDAQQSRFAGVERPAWRWPSGGYVPNWQVYLVVVDRQALPLTANTSGSAAPKPVAGPQRVSVLWNGDAAPLTVTLPARTERTALLDKFGRSLPLTRTADGWRIMLPGATAHSPLDPDGYYFVGGDPVLFIEDGVGADAPVSAPLIVA